jgi:hypothetical protein
MENEKKLLKVELSPEEHSQFKVDASRNRMSMKNFFMKVWKFYIEKNKIS